MVFVYTITHLSITLVMISILICLFLRRKLVLVVSGPSPGNLYSTIEREAYHLLVWWSLPLSPGNQKRLPICQIKLIQCHNEATRNHFASKSQDIEKNTRSQVGVDLKWIPTYWTEGWSNLKRDLHPINLFKSKPAFMSGAFWGLTFMVLSVNVLNVQS